jgi:hypothetical protein
MPELPGVPDPPPPFMGSWRRLYAAVLLYLCLIIAALYVFTLAYR